MVMSRLKKISLALITLLLLLGIGGYISAYVARPGVEKGLRTHVLTHQISGFDLGGDVPPGQIKVYSELSYPYVVTGTYVVPRDLHASYYRFHFLALPWGLYALSRDDFHSI